MDTENITVDEFIDQINEQRKTKTWYGFRGIVDHRIVELKGYKTWLQRFRVDGVEQALPMELRVKDFLDALEKPFLIKYTVTYEVVTPESAEHGEPEDQGVYSDNEVMTFDKALELLYATEPSTSPLRDDETHIWFQTIDPERDFETSAETRYSYHPVDLNDARVMIKAWKQSNNRNS